MITTTLAQLLKNQIVSEDDVDPGVFDSYVVSDGYALHAELEPDTWSEFVVIQRVLDEPGKEEHLILIDSHGNSTDMGSAKIDIHLFEEMDGDFLV